MDHLGCLCYWRFETQWKENDCFINMHVHDDYVKISNPILSHIKCHYWTIDIVDALSYRIEGDNDFMNDFSDLLLQKLFTTSIKACQDSDKVKSNAVRALGNILRYLPIRSLGQ